MPESPEILLLDDGELDDVEQILKGLGQSYGRVRGGAIAPNTPPPAKLLVATPRRIEAVRGRRGPGEGPEPIRIVVVKEDSYTLRARLRKTGFDYLVRRPVHPEALRLLVMRSLYEGDERRAEPRVPVGFEVSFKSGLLARRATLADLTSRSCRLLSRYELDQGKRIRLTLPEAVGASAPLTLHGRVKSSRIDEHLGDGDHFSTVVLFERLTPAQREELKAILAERAKGPASLKPLPKLQPDPRAEEAPPQPLAEPEPEAARVRAVRAAPQPKLDDLEVDVRIAGASDEDLELEAGPLDEEPVEFDLDAEAPQPVSRDLGVDTVPEIGDAGEVDAERPERRRTRRANYSRKVPAFASRSLRVLMGRDLSRGGMRIEKHPGLEIGDRLHLAVYGAAEEEPFLVWGTVARDDRSRGMAVVFDEVDPATADQLESIVASLPAVEPLGGGELAGMGSVVAEILDS
ncbi:MAG: PilZ domain-containing protein [Myxococcota bacterium]